MLKEIPETRQIEGEPRRRWFADEEFDLIIWYSARDEVEGIQLCYREKGSVERALTWLKGKGFSHNKIDDGEGMPERHKMTPILVPDGVWDRNMVLEHFEVAGAGLEQEIRELVAGVLKEYHGSEDKNNSV